MTIVLNATTGITTPPVSVEGSTSGTITLVAPAVAGTNTQTLVAATGTLAPLIAGTAQALTSGTTVDFTDIPSWAKRITVMLNSVSTSGTSALLIQIGDSGGIENTSYASQSVTMLNASASVGAAYTTGFGVISGAAANLVSGIFQICLVSGTTWVFGGWHTLGNATATTGSSAGIKALSDVLTQVRITTVNGTDTFDAGAINILYE